METKIPQIFVDIPTFEGTLGHYGWSAYQNELSGLNPSNLAYIEHNNENVVLEYQFLEPTTINSMWILGHNFNFANVQFNISVDDAEISLTERINYNSGTPSFDGFTMVTFALTEMNNLKVTLAPDGAYGVDTIKIGAICLSKAYEMTHNPDMSVQYSIIHDGVKQIRSRGGATLTNTMYNKPADWADIGGAWQLDNKDNYRMGIRQYDMTFSYYTNANTFTTKASSGNIDNLGIETSDNILNDTDFIASVWNKCNKQSPFIFMPDKTDYNIDQPLIGRFMGDLKVTQQAPALQSFSLTIRESF